MRVNNRRLAQGFYRGLDISDPTAVLRQVDKIDKIGAQQVADLLVSEVGLTASQAKMCVALAEISSADESFVDSVRALDVTTRNWTPASSCCPRWLPPPAPTCPAG